MCVEGSGGGGGEEGVPCRLSIFRNVNVASLNTNSSHIIYHIIISYHIVSYYIMSSMYRIYEIVLSQVTMVYVIYRIQETSMSP